MLNPNEKMLGANQLLKDLREGKKPVAAQLYGFAYSAAYFPEKTSDTKTHFERCACDMFVESLKEAVQLVEPNVGQCVTGAPVTEEARNLSDNDVSHPLNLRCQEILQDENESLKFRVLSGCHEITTKPEQAHAFGEASDLTDDEAKELALLLHKNVLQNGVQKMDETTRLLYVYMNPSREDATARQQSLAATNHYNLLKKARETLPYGMH